MLDQGERQPRLRAAGDGNGIGRRARRREKSGVGGPLSGFS